MIWFQFALRNIMKNRRRSLATTFAVALGFCSISIFHGYTQETYHEIAQSIIHGEGLGHITLFKRGYHEYGKLEPEKYLFRETEINAASKLVMQLDHVVLITPRLNVSGLISNGSTSTIFLGQGVIPADDSKLRGDFISKQGGLDSDKPGAVQLAAGLAGMLDLNINDTAVILGNTIDGMVNALDVDILSVFDTGIDATNDKLIRMTLQHARDFYATNGADKLVVLLDDKRYVTSVRQKIQALAPDYNLDIEARTWDELSVFYRQLRTLFDTIFLFIFIIVIIVAAMSVINTLSMTVLERVREIGTLRAIGVRRGGIKWMFSVEGGLLGMIGCVTGAGMTVIIYLVMHYMQFTFTPPSSTTEVILSIQLDATFMLALSVLLVLLALLSAYFPAKRAAQLPIVDALGHV